ncbi:hypothetical protein [Vibrio agarivorans]|uniref:Uncharacterized protein n=1 Tax=Vibrio agarivorans TaxID=153622 RepID=A0ABT7Y7A8_9VIBR|nr:hypothetical protein [Vibrio agarivorans]MDN2483873.1 hypothetical protein [Vibrio agarivorans]
MQTITNQPHVQTQGIKLPYSFVSKSQIANSALKVNSNFSPLQGHLFNVGGTPTDLLSGLVAFALELGQEVEVDEFVDGQRSFSSLVHATSTAMCDFVKDYTKEVTEGLLPSLLKLATDLNLSEVTEERVRDTLKAMPLLRLTIFDQVHCHHTMERDYLAVTAWCEYIEEFPFHLGATSAEVDASILAVFEELATNLFSTGFSSYADAGCEHSINPDAFGLNFSEVITKKMTEDRLIAHNEKYSYRSVPTEHFEKAYSLAALTEVYGSDLTVKPLVNAWFADAKVSYPINEIENTVWGSMGEYPFVLKLDPDSDIDEVFENFRDYDSPPFTLKLNGESGVEFIKSSIHAAVVMGMLFSLSWSPQES